MKKDEVLQRRERLVKAFQTRLEELHLPVLTDDGKLYHEELEGENRWAVRLSRQGVWPQLPPSAGVQPLPGLRLEVWFFQKRPEAWIGLLCSRRPPADRLRKPLEPWWKEWVEGGRFARRYKPLGELWQKSYPETDGICRILPLDQRLEEGLVTLARDVLPGIDKALSGLEGGEQLAQDFAEAGKARNPLLELAEKFNKKR